MRQRSVFFSFVCFCLIMAFNPGRAVCQKDPGPRGGSASAGGPYPGLTPQQLQMYETAEESFMEVDSVTGTLESGSGLGPGFNGNSCAGCHAEPALGGSSPGMNSAIDPQPNPQVALAALDGATNYVPSFITANGPVREARFVTNPDGTPDGGVHNVFTIAGRMDALSCKLSQPNFAAAIAQHNIGYRIPTPLFGLGLVDITPDEFLENNLAANAATKSSMGVGGRFNRNIIGGEFNTSGNDGTITKFGWKAQNKSLLVFAGEAYNVEMGVTNEMFPNERNAYSGCIYNGTPEDFTNADGPGTNSDVTNFAIFSRLSAPPTPVPLNADTSKGMALFTSVGCALCHTPTLTTGQSSIAAMSNVQYHPYSDFALHHMGPGLADGITQGNAGPDEFRTAPLWGVGQRLFFLHDGRTADLLQAIEDHASSSTTANSRWSSRANSRTQVTGSEANGVIRQFNRLSPSQKQEILDFLRSL